MPFDNPENLTEIWMKRKKQITHDELQESIVKFIKKGGIIQKLPDQKTALQNRVGGKWGTSEMGGVVTN
jgi:hypothetical protein